MPNYSDIRTKQQAYWTDVISKTTSDVPPHFAAVSPTVNSDFDAGFRKGQIWLNTVTNVSYICEDATVGAAIWNTL